MLKKIVILDKPKGCRLANQLWNWISVYAYCLEMGYKCVNLCFYEDKKQPTTANRSYDNYYRYFNIPNSRLIRILLWLHIQITRINTRPRLFNRYVDFIKKTHFDKIVFLGEENFFYLPPSNNNNANQIRQIKKIQDSPETNFYLDGWQFRNPEGIKKYRQEITEYFKPKDKIIKNVKKFLVPLKKEYENIIGVHIRQKDYKFLFEDSFYFSPEQTKEILDNYLRFSQLDKKKTLFLICSDGTVNLKIFQDLNVVLGLGGVVEDLYALSLTDLIIGTDSTFGPLAAYCGNIPFIVFEKNIDWEYYRGRNKYFENYKIKNLFPFSK